MVQLPEKKESLWMLVASPVIWSAHFLVSYIVAAIWCEKMGPDASFTTLQALIAAFTAVALAGIGVFLWMGYRRFTLGGATVQDRDTPQARHRFLGFATLLLSGLSAVAVLYEALVAVFIGGCY